MTVARTCARKRRQMKLDPRYGRVRGVISKKLQGRSKLIAQRELTSKGNVSK